MRGHPIRPFCRDERNGHICHRMLGHTGPHIERHRQIGDDRPDVEWFTTVEYVRPAVVTRESIRSSASVDAGGSQ